jgi:cell division protein FtsL
MIKRINKKILKKLSIEFALKVAILVLVLSLVFVLLWNFNLKKEIKELNENIDILSVNAVNDFSLFVMSKVDKCEAVTLMAEDKTITINNVECSR